MTTFPLRSDTVSLAVTETGAQLSDVTFTLPDGRSIQPMHTAPWTDDEVPPDTPPVLRLLRGDFLCAPFGSNDVIPDGGPAHGLTASGLWKISRHSDSALEATLDGDIMGAAVSLHIEVRPGEPVIYQRHVLKGGAGRIPIGHHAMLVARHPLLLGFSRHIFAGTPPDEIETPPQGTSVLAYPQDIIDIEAARLKNGTTADLTRYPFAQSHEDLWMLSADPTLQFGWTAATCPEEGWVWFALKDPKILPSTTLWLSNGGRTYPPWSSRHRGVIGLEEVCSYFHLGHAASIADNPVAARGIPTAVALGGDVVVNYAFGLAPTPDGFGAVAAIESSSDGIELRDASGKTIRARCDLSFISRSR